MESVETVQSLTAELQELMRKLNEKKAAALTEIEGLMKQWEITLEDLKDPPVQISSEEAKPAESEAEKTEEKQENAGVSAMEQPALL